MVIFVERFSKLYNKLENNIRHHQVHHHEDEAFTSASLQNFRSKVSSLINQLGAEKIIAESNLLSFSFIQQCFQMLDLVNKDFAKLVVEIDYPMNRWETKLIEEYMSYSLDLLDMFNSVTRELSYLKQARLSLAYALSLIEDSPSLAIQSLKPIEPKNLSYEFKEKDMKNEEKPSSGKEKVIFEALTEAKSVGYWLFGLFLAAIRGNSTPYSEMKRVCGQLANCTVSETILEREFVLKEIKEVNEAVTDVLVNIASMGKASDAAEKLQRRLEGYEKKLDGLGTEVERLFAGILARRNELLSIIRQKQYNESA
ncbi:hypothetical protein ACFE04_010007 [Oxalis oulophora]